MTPIHIINVSQKFGDGPMYSHDLLTYEPNISPYIDRAFQITESLLNELHSPFYLNIFAGKNDTYTDRYLPYISKLFVGESIRSELYINKIFEKVPLMGWEDTTKLKAENLLIEQKLLFELVAKIELIHAGVLPLHSFGNIDGEQANIVGMRYLNVQEKKSVANLDWLTIFMNAGEQNTSIFSRKPSIATFIPILLHDTYLSLVRENFSERDALRLVMTAISPINLNERPEVYQSKMHMLEEMGKRIPVDSNAKKEFDEIISMYSSTSDSIWIQKR